MARPTDVQAWAERVQALKRGGNMAALIEFALLDYIEALELKVAEHERIPLVLAADYGPYRRGDVYGYMSRAEWHAMTNARYVALDEQGNVISEEADDGEAD